MRFGFTMNASVDEKKRKSDLAVQNHAVKVDRRVSHERLADAEVKTFSLDLDILIGSIPL